MGCILRHRFSPFGDLRHTRCSLPNQSLNFLFQGQIDLLPDLVTQVERWLLRRPLCKKIARGPVQGKAARSAEQQLFEKEITVSLV